MAKYLFVESEEGNDYFKTEFEENTSNAQRQAIWGALHSGDGEAAKEIINSIEILHGQDFNISDHELDENTVSAFYDRDLIDYDADKARGFVKVN